MMTALRRLRGHRLSVTCVCVADDATWVWSGSKDGSIRKWHLVTGALLHVAARAPRAKRESAHRGTGPAVVGHSGAVLGLAVSTDVRYLVRHVLRRDAANRASRCPAH